MNSATLNTIGAFIAAALICTALALSGFYVYAHPNVIPNIPFIAPCSQPINYKIGTIDPRFGLTSDQIASQLESAAAIWNTAAGKTVLTYAPNDSMAMPVNFVYDSRQQTVSLGQKIDSTEASQETARASIEADQQAYLTAQQQYANAVAAFNSESAAYSAQVKQVNASGGADPATYQKLNAQKTQLADRQRELNAEGEQLGEQGSALKEKIDAFNSSVQNINKVVSNFNSTVGGDFEEGQYVQDGSGRHIDVYAYKSQKELLHTLAHEFGHSLGLDHNSNPASIMFPYNKEGVTLSKDDVAALTSACHLS